MAVIELMEHITDPEKDQGEWVAKIDLVESGDKLLVQEQDELGDCGVECKTVQRAAEEIVGDQDTDLAEELWKVSLLTNSAQNFISTLCCYLGHTVKPDQHLTLTYTNSVSPTSSLLAELLCCLNNLQACTPPC